jgi:Domain of unknown function (DUF4394)
MLPSVTPCKTSRAASSMRLLAIAAAAAATATFAALPAGAQSSAMADSMITADAPVLQSLISFGLTADQRLVRFRVAAPQNPRVVGSISGLSGADTMVIGIDFRVQDGKLYGVGNGGGIYTIDTRFATAMKVSQLTVPLSGMLFGVDFNPAANALRIVSDAGQNLSHSIDTGVTNATPQAPLSFPALPAGTKFAVTGAAYVNNDLDPATGTTLFDIDTTNNLVAIQSPPGTGVLNAAGSLTVDAGSQAGFDIYSTLRKGVTTRNMAFASLSVGGKTGLYGVNVITGKALLIGNFNLPVVDIALPLNQ